MPMKLRGRRGDIIVESTGRFVGRSHRLSANRWPREASQEPVDSLWRIAHTSRCDANRVRGRL
jgi:hypothetical protein